MHTFRSILATTVILAALLIPAPAFANDQGTQPGGGVPPVQQQAPAPPAAEPAEDDDGPSTLVILAVIAGALVLAAGLAALQGRNEGRTASG